MKIKAKYYSRSSGFTVVEMVVTVAIILVLVSLIVPALNMVRSSADMARQRAQFHSIDIALEAFRADYGDYPRSEDTVDTTNGYPGAQKLAEALIGQDSFGFHPRSEFTNTGRLDTDGDGVYDDEAFYLPDVAVDIDNDGSLTAAQREAAKRENLAARWGPYLELETANAVRLRDIYDLQNEPTPNTETNGLKNRFVLCDMFRVVKNNATGKRAGMPILYFRANTLEFKHDIDGFAAGRDELEEQLEKQIYNFQDNWRFVALTKLWGSLVKHPMDSSDPYDNPNGDFTRFYKDILNPNFTSPRRPYRMDSYILLSAGPDGEFGSPDDVYNFDKGESQ